MKLSPSRQAEYDELGLPLNVSMDNDEQLMDANGYRADPDQIRFAFKAANRHHELEETVERLLDLLYNAKCPECDGVGWTVEPSMTDGEPQQLECRWCHEKAGMFLESEAAL